MDVTFYPVLDLNDAPGLLEQLGTKEKFWFGNRPSKNQFLFKYSRDRTGEHWSEKCAEQICCLLGVPHVQYDLARYNGRLGVVTPNIITSGNQYLVMGNELLYRDSPREYPQPVDFFNDKSRVTDHTVQRVIAFLDKASANIQPPLCDYDLDGLTASGVFCGYLMLDVLISNQDRHHENWAVIVESRNGQTMYRLCPSYDHAASLGREMLDSQREERLLTKDKNRSIEQFVAKASSQLYRTKTDKKPMKTLDAFLYATERKANVRDFWLNKLNDVSDQSFKLIFDRIPEDLISDLGRKFSYQMVLENKKRLLEYL